MPEDKISKINEYGKMDLTAYNAIGLMSYDNFEIQLGGKKYLGQNSCQPLTKSKAIKITEQLIGVSLHRNTWFYWEKQKLIPSGKTNGKYKIFPGCTPYEACASWTMMHGPFGCSSSKVQEIRAMALETGIEVLSPFDAININEKTPEFNPESIYQHTNPQNPNRVLAYFWMRYRLFAEVGLNPQDESKIISFVKKAKNFPNEPYKYIIEIW